MAELEDQLLGLRQQRAEAEARYKQEARRRRENIAGTLAEIGRWQLLAEEVREFQDARRHRDDAQSRVDALDQQIRESRERQGAAQADRDRRHRRLCNYFDWVLKRLLGQDAGGTVHLDARGLHPTPANSVAVNGAAIATLATVLGFDLACLTATVCGVGSLPGFLLHDSPKEADMEPTLYERIFILALELVQAYKEQTPAFQYIITTTTPPPAEAATEPHVRLTLDAREDAGLLLKTRF